MIEKIKIFKIYWITDYFVHFGTSQLFVVIVDSLMLENWPESYNFIIVVNELLFNWEIKNTDRYEIQYLPVFY